MKRILFLPLALTDAALRSDAPHLSRQLPGAIRDALEERVPGSTRFTPMASGDDRARRWVAPEILADDDAVVAQARRRRCGMVIYGALAAAPTTADPRAVALTLRGIRLADGRVALRRAFSGSLARVVACSLEAIESLDARFAGAASAFGAELRDAAAFEAYLEGLDALLSVRTPGLKLARPEAAMAPFERALALDPDHENALAAGLGLAVSIVEKERTDVPLDPVLDVLAGWSRSRPDDARIPAVRADLLLSRGRLEEALDVLRDALDDGLGDDRDLLRRRADVEIRLRRHRDARATITRCLELGEDAGLRRRAALLALVFGDHEAAREDLARLVVTDDDDAALWSRLGLAELELGRMDAAREAFARMFRTTLGPANDDLGHLARLLENEPAGDALRAAMGDWRPPESLAPSGRLVLARCLRLADERLRARLCLRSIRAESLVEADRLTLARERFELDHPGFDARYAAIARRTAEDAAVPDADVAFLTDALDEDPGFWPARFLVGICHARRRDHRRALAEIERVLEQRPDSDVAWYTRGLQLLELDRPADARGSFERAIALNDSEAEYHDRLAICHARLGDPDKAREAIGRAQRLGAGRERR